MAPRKSTDPIKAAARRAKGQRRVGQSACCTQCGEKRPEALIPRTRPRLCEECHRRRRGMKTTDHHHVAGKSNSPITIEVPANMHRAVLSPAQYEWPPATLENKDGSPVLSAAAALRCSCDLITELIVRFITLCAAFLETLDGILRERLGHEWWIGTSLDGWAPQ